ncbi:hypothetical protein METHB2_70051 [Candidatus Methylobacter favarea]|uniref:Transposase DDE domain-containing protein n=1 Tax=Candidatus Methylobacter favarea TaxID=2707345 RepID=A0A8S0X349_9GAMM|nr:transposase [Candidatus Methylobacter favarea]CAA9892444.1 hypothetical protein METHB2_70051 [Candidatus Methylobacter favarea]
MLEIIQQEQEEKNQGQVWLIDSFPVALAKQGHRFKARVARELADAGYCPTKKLYYYGVRVHIVGRRQAGVLPNPEYMGVTGASCHDGTVFDQIRPELNRNELYGDKAYHRSDAKDVRETQNLTVLTPVKKQKGQVYLEPRINGYRLPFLVSGSRLKLYSAAFNNKQALNARVKFDHTAV